MNRKHIRQGKSVHGHCFEGTHKLDDPVSNMTLNFCGGVPKLISP